MENNNYAPHPACDSEGTTPVMSEKLPATDRLDNALAKKVKSDELKEAPPQVVQMQEQGKPVFKYALCQLNTVLDVMHLCGIWNEELVRQYSAVLEEWGLKLLV